VLGSNLAFRRNVGPATSAGAAAMTNSRLHALIALGGVLIVGAFVAFLPPIPPVSAQGHAQRICREEGISQASEHHEICLGSGLITSGPEAS
jgi:hypothetical protein